jgi:diguanylate cyclase (GGDEF)-like protein
MLAPEVIAWTGAGVVGVGLTAGAALWHLGQLLRQRFQPQLAIAWLLVAAGALLGLPGHPQGSRGLGGTLVVAGLLLLGRSLRAPSAGSGTGSAGILLLVALPLGIAALILPPELWRGLYGLALLVLAVWLAPRAGEEGSRRLLDIGIVLLGLAGIVLMAGAIRSSLALGSGGIVGLLVLGGMVALASGTVLGVAAGELGELRRTLGDLEDDHEHLLRLTESDPLTGCPTRRALRAWFERWPGGEPVSVGLLDVHGLKRINERHGHAAGDEALRLLAGVLSSSTRPGDLVARWGGDEFVVVLRGAGREAATRRVASLMAAVDAAAAGFPYEAPLRVDWGVATCSSPADIARALAEADDRMFAMKRRRDG